MNDGQMVLRFGEEKVVFKLHRAMKKKFFAIESTDDIISDCVH